VKNGIKKSLGPLRGKIRKILINLQKKLFSWTSGRNALIFGLKHLWERLFKFVQMKFLGSC